MNVWRSMSFNRWSMLSPLLWQVIPIEIFVSSAPRVYWFTILSSLRDESAVLILVALNTSYLKPEERPLDQLEDNAPSTARIHQGPTTRPSEDLSYGSGLYLRHRYQQPLLHHSEAHV